MLARWIRSFDNHLIIGTLNWMQNKAGVIQDEHLGHEDKCAGAVSKYIGNNNCDLQWNHLLGNDHWFIFEMATFWTKWFILSFNFQTCTISQSYTNALFYPKKSVLVSSFSLASLGNSWRLLELRFLKRVPKQKCQQSLTLLKQSFCTPLEARKSNSKATF